MQAYVRSFICSDELGDELYRSLKDKEDESVDQLISLIGDEYEFEHNTWSDGVKEDDVKVIKSHPELRESSDGNDSSDMDKEYGKERRGSGVRHSREARGRPFRSHDEGANGGQPSSAGVADLVRLAAQAFESQLLPMFEGYMDSMKDHIFSEFQTMKNGVSSARASIASLETFVKAEFANLQNPYGNGVSNYSMLATSEVFDMNNWSWVDPVFLTFFQGFFSTDKGCAATGSQTPDYVSEESIAVTSEVADIHTEDPPLSNLESSITQPEIMVSAVQQVIFGQEIMIHVSTFMCFSYMSHLVFSHRDLQRSVLQRILMLYRYSSSGRLQNSTTTSQPDGFLRYSKRSRQSPDRRIAFLKAMEHAKNQQPSERDSFQIDTLMSFFDCTKVASEKAVDHVLAYIRKRRDAKGSFSFSPCLQQPFIKRPQWFKKVDVVYVPVIVKKIYWVGLVVDLNVWAMYVVASNTACPSELDLASVVTPLSILLPHLIGRYSNSNKAQELNFAPMTISRLDISALEEHPGQCCSAVVTLMLLEMHAVGKPMNSLHFSEEQVKTAAENYAIEALQLCQPGKLPCAE
ncbi:unnamed protein product [Eruca vesicaria subsp. sativa]|uniref:Ubiquitin-like protease family profile domain-containing protein n=1 Tax=Eruca vesicaria subsp. sativa TaxID=29727 RepID=A0ABC8M9T4_ERUVS|nr:unnamed protein product [Eruca vesicaria subsp. sativa]